MSKQEFTPQNISEYEEKIFEAVQATFENLLFCEIEKVNQEFHLDGEILCLDIIEPYKGFFLVSIPKSLSAEIASTVLGIDAEMLTDSLLVDSSGEVLNTIAGHFLRSMVKEGGTFNLGLPRIVKATELPASHVINTHFAIGEGVLGLSLRW